MPRCGWRSVRRRVQREVALKIRRSRNGPDLTDTLPRSSATSGPLEHAHIARFSTPRVSADGPAVPRIEYVRASLLRWADHIGWASARASSVLQGWQAVQYGPRQGGCTGHKPGNVLVTMRAR